MMLSIFAETKTQINMESIKDSQTLQIGKYADILMDRWFKRTFGSEQRKRLTELLLQLLIPEHDIVSIKLAPIEHVNPFEEDKDIRVDVECTDEDGTRFIVELQLAPKKNFYERAIFNSSFGIQQQIPVGVKRYDYSPVYFIGIMDFSLHEESDKMLYRYNIREVESNELMSDRLQYIFIELPNVVKRKEDAKTLMQRVMYSIKNLPRMDSIPKGWDKDEIIKLLFDYAKIANFAAEERVKYINDMTTKRDIENQIEYAAEKGEEKGRKETARNFKHLGVPAETICKATGLSAEEVAAL